MYRGLYEAGGVVEELILLDFGMAGTRLGLKRTRTCLLVDRGASQDDWIFGCNFPTIMPPYQRCLPSK